MLMSDMGVIDSVFVISLAFLALSLMVFLIFFVPVLVQLSKTLEAVQTLINIFKNYIESVNHQMADASKNMSKLGSYITELASTLGEGVSDLVFNKK